MLPSENLSRLGSWQETTPSMFIGIKRGITAVTAIQKRHLKQALVKRTSKYRETEMVNLSRSLYRKIKQH